MNRKILYLFTLLTFIFCALFLQSCTKDCAHQYGEWIVKTEATCAVEGKETRTCSLCNETEEKTIPATGEHNISDGVCTVCRKTEIEIEN